jgi:hypothetical protein
MTFVENVLLLLITAALTGLLVPIIRSIMDDRKLLDQKRLDAELARQGAIIDAQVQLLNDISALVWEYMLALIGVSYYKVNGDAERFQHSLDEYGDSVGGRFGKMQAEFSKAQRLAPRECIHELQDMYRLFPKLDVSLMGLVRAEAEPAEWRDHHNNSFSSQSQVSTTLYHLAEGMGLTAGRPDHWAPDTRASVQSILRPRSLRKREQSAAEPST